MISGSMTATLWKIATMDIVTKLTKIFNLMDKKIIRKSHQVL